MKECFRLIQDSVLEPDFKMELNFQQRQKSRYKAQTVCGETLGWFLDRGRVLEDGDLLLCEDDSSVLVIAADETVSEVHSDNPHLLMRASYHLGNRHVPLQIGESTLRYQHDHVLDEMLIGLGLTVACCQRPFHPENGAYHSKEGLGTNNAGHDHSHSTHSHHDHAQPTIES